MDMMREENGVEKMGEVEGGNEAESLAEEGEARGEVKDE